MTDLFDRLQHALGDAYRLESEMGGGGMSRVFLAEETALHRKVVIKLLPPDTAAGVNRERFEREIQLSARLQHPHVVSLLTTGSHQDLLYYVMPLIEGESLRAKLAREGELPIGESLKILREVADALAYAHRHDVVHRDIKPDNVLLSEGHAVVTDFGVAKAVSASSGGTASSLTSMGVALGTPAYMSPEQAAADPHVDHRADIYALGALAYEMLTGRPPFVKQTPQQILAAHVNETPERVTVHRDSVPAALDEVIMRCLAKRPADRWQTTDEIRQQFEQMTTPQSGGVTPTGTAPFASVGPSGITRLVNTPLKLGMAYAGAVAFLLLFAYAVMIAFGLPDWVFVGAIILLVIGAPIVLRTGRRERERAVAATTGMQMATPVGLEKHFTWRKALSGGLLAFVTLAVVAGGYMGLRAAGIGPAATLVTSGVLDAQDRLLVAEFEDRTGDGDMAPSITEALRIDLSQSPTIRVMGQAGIEASLARMGLDNTTTVTIERAREIAQREGIKAVVAGDVGEIGSGYVVSARLLSGADGTELFALRENAGNPDELIDAVGRLSQGMRERIGESLKSIRASVALPQVTTASLEALRLYTRGHRHYQAGLGYEEAARLMDEAIALDSNFAMAYRYLSVVLGNAGGREAGRRLVADQRLFDLRDRLPPLERQLAAARYYSTVVKDTERALQEYAAALEIDPDNLVALNNSGVWLNDEIPGRHAEAEPLYRRAIDGPEPVFQNFMGLMQTQIAQLKWEEAERTVQEFRAWNPDHSAARRAGTVMQVARMNYRAVDSLIVADPDVHPGNWRTDVLRIRGKFSAAFALHRVQASEAQRSGASVDYLNAELRVLQARALYLDTVGVRADLLRALQEASWEQIPIVDRPHTLVAEIHALTGHAEEVRQLHGEWAEVIARFPREEAAFEALVATAEGRHSDAATGYVAANAMQGRQARYLGAAGRSYRLAGMADSSLVTYRRFVDVGDQRRRGRDSQFLAEALRTLGELYEERGDMENAIEFYSRFVDLWEDADPELQPIVSDVRGRIARLAAER